MNESREQRKIRRKKEAHELNRPGYWSCEECTTHNLTTLPHCTVCGTLNWMLRDLGHYANRVSSKQLPY